MIANRLLKKIGLARRIDQLANSDLYRKVAGDIRGLEPRDRFALGLLTAFFMILVVVFGIWQPAYDYAVNAEKNRDRQRELLHWMNATESQARASAGNQSSIKKSGRSLITLVSSTAQQAGIKPNKLQPEGTDEVSVWFDSVPFNNLVTWLETLQKKQGILVRQISLDRQEQAGIVNARLVLTQ
jgi:general secretion pathway protein M